MIPKCPNTFRKYLLYVLAQNTDYWSASEIGIDYFMRTLVYV